MLYMVPTTILEDVNQFEQLRRHSFAQKKTTFLEPKSARIYFRHHNKRNEGSFKITHIYKYLKHAMRCKG